MLDLKNQLLKAGLVTEEQVDKVEKEEADRRQKARARRDAKKNKGKGKGKGQGKGKGPRRGKSDAQLWKERMAKLKAGGKAEQYDAIRNWVKRHRLDPDGGLPSEEAERFHFEKEDGGISWLTIEPHLKKEVSEGRAGIVAYMSNHGLVHCVVPKQLAEDIGQLRPEWVRHLKGWVAVARKEESEPKEDVIETKEGASEPKEAETVSESKDDASDA